MRLILSSLLLLGVLGCSLGQQHHGPRLRQAARPDAAARAALRPKASNLRQQKPRQEDFLQECPFSIKFKFLLLKFFKVFAFLNLFL